MIDAIRDEHARVFMQDQALLKTIKEQKTSSPIAAKWKQISQKEHAPQSELHRRGIDSAALTASFDKRSNVQTEGEQRVTDPVGTPKSEDGEDAVQIHDQASTVPRDMTSLHLLEPFKKEILLRQKDPIYLSKPIALVEETVKYDY